MRQLLIPLLAVMVGCSTAERTSALENAPKNGNDAIDSALLAALRVDVFPPTGLESESGVKFDGLAQSPGNLPSTEGTVNADLVLERSVNIEGTFTGWQVTPWLDAEIPGEEVPLAASVSISRPETVQSYNLQTNPDNGRMPNIDIVPDLAYRIAVVPEDPEIPFLVFEQDLDRSRDISEFVSPGSTVWGQILDDTGTPMSGIGVRARSIDTGITGAIATSNDDGWYTLRVLPGAYIIESVGMQTGREPMLELSATIDELGQEVGFSYPNLDLINVSGRVIGDDALDDVIVRFTAVELDGYADLANDGIATSMVVEDETTSQGNFATRLIPGTWMVEFIPPSDEAFAPQRIAELEVGNDEIDLGELQLDAFVTVSGSAVDPSGATVGSARIDCVEIGFGARRFSAVAGPAGGYSFDMPPVPLECVLTPPAGQENAFALTRRVVDPSVGRQIDFDYNVGTLVRGQVVLDNGDPVPFAVVELRDNEQVLWGVALTDQDGAYDLLVAVYDEED